MKVKQFQTFITFNLCGRRPVSPHTSCTCHSACCYSLNGEPTQNQPKMMENGVSSQGWCGKTVFFKRYGNRRIEVARWFLKSPQELTMMTAAHPVTGCTLHCLSGWEVTVPPSAEDGRSSCYHPCGFKALMCTPCVWSHCRSQLALGPQ